MAERSLAKRAWYVGLRAACRTMGLAAWGLRVWGREHIPVAGAALVLGNHQSHFDSVLLGLGCDRRMNYVARQNLFRFAPFRWLIQSLDAIPIDREGTGLAGLKETLRRLKRGEIVLLFPEGTRTPDGRMHSFKPGFCGVARRGGAAIVPAAVAGAFEAWPRSARLPRRDVIYVAYGPAMSPAEIATFDDDALVAEVERRVRRLHDWLCRQRARVRESTV